MNTIPNDFANFKQRELARGVETCSTTEYKGYQIFLRAYTGSGIWYRIFKQTKHRKYKLRERGYNFKLPSDLLQEAKNYIDNYSIKLEDKFTRLSN